MRDRNNVLEQLIQFAEEDENIRALVLQGSFVNKNVELDDFSDLDPLFFVKDVTPFIEKVDWKNRFGKPISWFHDEGLSHDNQKWYTRLTIYDDGFKIDFGFQSIALGKYANEMPLYRIYVDKDNIIPLPEVSDERKFYVKQPTQEEFLERIQTFFYDTSYVAKALARDEIFFAKHIDADLKSNKIKPLLDWYLGVKFDFQVNPGLMGRYYHSYLDKETRDLLLETYTTSNKEETAKVLLKLFDLVHQVGTFIAKELNFAYPYQQEQDMRKYCEDIFVRYLSMKIL